MNRRRDPKTNATSTLAARISLASGWCCSEFAIAAFHGLVHNLDAPLVRAVHASRKWPTTVEDYELMMTELDDHGAPYVRFTKKGDADLVKLLFYRVCFGALHSFFPEATPAAPMAGYLPPTEEALVAAQRLQTGRGSAGCEYFLSVALQRPPTALGDGSHAYASLLYGLQTQLLANSAQWLHQGAWPVAFGDASRALVELELRAGKTFSLLWSAPGVGWECERGPGVPEPLTLDALCALVAEVVARGKQPPSVIFICLECGARLAAQRLCAAGAPTVVWVRRSLYSHEHGAKLLFGVCAPLLQRLRQPKLACAPVAVLSEVAAALGRSCFGASFDGIGCCCAGGSEILPALPEWRREVLPSGVWVHNTVASLSAPPAGLGWSLATMGGSRYDAHDELHESMTLAAIDSSGSAFDLLQRYEPEAIVEWLLQALPRLPGASPSPIAALYADEAVNVGPVLVVRLCISSVGYLHELSDAALTGELEQRLSCVIPAVAKATEEADRQNYHSDAVYRFLHQYVRIGNLSGRHAALNGRCGLASGYEDGAFVVVTEGHETFNIPPQFLSRIGGHQRADQKAIDEVLQAVRTRADVWESGPFKVKVDRSRFARAFEASVCALDRLTPHQQIKLQETRLSRHVHLRAPAGAGKTFVALHRLLGQLLENDSGGGRVLFVARNKALGFLVVRWLCERVRNTLQRLATLRRLHLLHEPFTAGPKAIRLTRGTIALTTPLKAAPAAADAYSLVIVDEAHHIYKDPALARAVAAYTPPTAELLLLSDISQSTGREIGFPHADFTQVVLSEVVRSSQRIVSGTAAFALNGPDEAVVTSQHAASGPPLKSFLFEPHAEADAVQSYVAHILVALEHVTTTFGSMSLHNRLAIIVADAPFASRLRAALQPALARHFPPRNFTLVSATAASCSLMHEGADDATRGEQWLALDEVSEFDGLERLIVLAVGLDAPVEAAVATEALETRSRLYRALTRAHLMAIVVQARVRGGWLEFLGQLALKATQDALTFKQDNARLALTSGAAKVVTAKAKARVESQEANVPPSNVPPATSAAPGGDGTASSLDSSKSLASLEDVTTVVAQSIWDTSANTLTAAAGPLTFMPFKQQEMMYMHEVETTVRGGQLWWFDSVKVALPLDESTPVVATYEVWTEDGNIEVIGGFSLSRTKFNTPQCDALTWYAAVHRADFTFRTKMFGAPNGRFVPSGAGRPFKISPEVWHSVEVRLSKKRAEYSIDGRLFASGALDPADTPDEGYFGMVTYDTTYKFRNLKVIKGTAGGAGSDPIAGSYLCTQYIGNSGENDWHHVTLVSEPDGTYKWNNRAGRTWTLTMRGDGNLDVGTNCPYYETHKVCRVLREGERVAGLLGPFDERYDKEVV